MLRLPRRVRASELPHILKSVVGADLKPLASERLEVGFDALDKIHAEGVVVLFSLYNWSKSHGVDLVIRRPREPLSWGNAYLDQVGFFELTTGSRLDEANTALPTLLPVEFVRNDKSEMWARQRLPTWLGRRLNASPDEFEVLRIGVGEIFNNIIDHSGQSGGCAFAQHYPNEGVVRISISDVGVGIPANVRTKEPALTDEAALYRSVEEGFSTQSTPRNRGAGLHTLLSQVVSEKGGEATIVSGGARLTARPGIDDMEVTVRSLGADTLYPGTLLTLKLPTSSLADPFEEDGEFQWT